MTPKLTVDSFAEKIKSKYPQYKDMDNYALTEKIVAKYPQYGEQVELKKPDSLAPKAEDGGSQQKPQNNLDSQYYEGRTEHISTPATGLEVEVKEEVPIEKEKSFYNTFKKSAWNVLRYQLPSATLGSWAATHGAVQDILDRDAFYQPISYKNGQPEMINGRLVFMGEQPKKRLSEFTPEEQELIKKERETVKREVKGDLLKVANDFQQEGAKYTEGLINSIDKIESPLDALNWVSNAVGQGVSQIPVSAATLGSSSVLQEVGGIYLDAVQKTAEEETKKRGVEVTAQDIIEEGLDEPAIALTFGVAAGALDYLGAGKVLSNFSKNALGNELRERGLKMLLSGGETVLTESLTEGAQTAIEQVGAQVGAGKDISEVKLDWKEIGEAAAQGGVGASGITTTGAIIGKLTNGKSIKSDLVDVPQSELERQVVTMQANGVIDEKTAQQIMSEKKKVDEANTKVPQGVNNRQEVVAKIAEKDELEKSKETVDEVFHESIDKQIEDVKNELKALITPKEEKVEETKTETNDKENITGLPSQERIGEEPVQAEPDEGAGGKEIGAGGNVQAQEEVDERLKEIGRKAEESQTAYIQKIGAGKFEATNPFSGEKKIFDRREKAAQYVFDEAIKARTKRGRIELAESTRPRSTLTEKEEVVSEEVAEERPISEIAETASSEKSILNQETDLKGGKKVPAMKPIDKSWKRLKEIGDSIRKNYSDKIDVLNSEASKLRKEISGKQSVIDIKKKEIRNLENLLFNASHTQVANIKEKIAKAKQWLDKHESDIKPQTDRLAEIQSKVKDLMQEQVAKYEDEAKELGNPLSIVDEGMGILNLSDYEYDRPDFIERAVKNNRYQQWISEGRMTANDAKTIIESAGLEVPKDIAEKAGKADKTKDESILSESKKLWEERSKKIDELQSKYSGSDFVNAVTKFDKEFATTHPDYFKFDEVLGHSDRVNEAARKVYQEKSAKFLSQLEDAFTKLLKGEKKVVNEEKPKESPTNQGKEKIPLKTKITFEKKEGRGMSKKPFRSDGVIVDYDTDSDGNLLYDVRHTIKGKESRTLVRPDEIIQSPIEAQETKTQTDEKAKIPQEAEVLEEKPNKIIDLAQKQKKKNNFRKAVKKYANWQATTPRQAVLQFFAAGGRINQDEAIKRTGYKPKDLFGWTSKKGLSYDDLIAAIRDEYQGEIDELNLRNEIDGIISGKKKSVYDELKQVMSAEKGELEYDENSALYEETSDLSEEEQDAIIDHSDTWMDDALTDEQRAELDGIIAEGIEQESQERIQQIINQSNEKAKQTADEGAKGNPPAESSVATSDKRKGELEADLKRAKSKLDKAQKALSKAQESISGQKDMFRKEEQGKLVADDKGEMQKQMNRLNREKDIAQAEVEKLEQDLTEYSKGQTRMEIPEKVSFSFLGQTLTGTQEGNKIKGDDGKTYTIGDKTGQASDVKTEGQATPQHSIDITPEMKRAVEKGLPLFGSIDEQISQAKKELKEASDAFKTMGAVFDPKAEAEKQLAYHKALVKLAGLYIQKGINTVEDFIKELSDEVKKVVSKEQIQKAWDEVMPKEQQKVEGEKKKTILTKRAYEGDLREEVKKYLEEKGLTRKVVSQEERSQQASDFIKEYGEETAIEAVRNFDARGGQASSILAQALKRINSDMAKLKATDTEKLDALAKEYAEIAALMEREGFTGGEFAGQLAYEYQDDALGFNVEKAINDYKDVNKGEIPAEVEAKIRELGRQNAILNERIAELEKENLEDKKTIENIKESVEREKKRRPKTSEQIKLTTDKIVAKVKQGKIHRPGIFAAATPASIAWDGALDTVALAIKATGRTAEAIAKGLEYIKETDWYKGLNADKQQEAEDAYNDFWKVKPTFEVTPKGIKIPHSTIRDFVERGIDNIEDLTKKVHEVIKETNPEVTEREVRDAITGYGKTVNPNQDEVEMQIRKMKRIGRIVSALEDIANKKRPLRSGQQRDKLDAQERALQKELREAMKDLPIDEETEATQLRTRLDAAKKRVQNQIEDLQREIDKGEQTPQNARTTQEDAELKDLKERLAEKKAEHAAIFKDEETKNTKRLELTKKYAQRSIEELERRIREKDFAPKKKTPLISDDELTNLKAEKLRLKEEYEKEKYKAELQNRTKTQKAIDSLWDLWGIPRLLMATGEASFVGVQGGIQTLRNLVHNRPALREAFKNAWNAFKSEKKSEDFLHKLKSQDYYPLIKESGLAITEPSVQEKAAEELFMTKWTDTIWNLMGAPLKLKSNEAFETWKKYNPLKTVFRPFERAAVGYLDTLRVSRFLDGKEILERKGIPYNQENKQSYKDVADYINTMTGRASLGFLEGKSASYLTKIFFSPRNWASVFKTGTPYGLYHFGKMTPTARKMALADFSTYVGLTTSMVALAAVVLNNDDDEETKVELDPRSSDFGKIKIGDKRIDPWGGRIQQVILTSRLLAEGLHQVGMTEGGYKTTSTEEIVPLGTPRKSDTAQELLLKQAFNKMNPAASFFREMLATEERKGERVDEYGQPYELSEELKERLYPIYWGTLIDLYKDDPSALNGLLAFYAFFGGGVNVYDKKEKKSNIAPVAKVAGVAKVAEVE